MVKTRRLMAGLLTVGAMLFAFAGSNLAQDKAYPKHDTAELYKSLKDVINTGAKIFNDEDHSYDEKREIIVGHSTNQRLILVSFTETGNRIRIISAREATRTERRDYEENAES